MYVHTRSVPKITDVSFIEKNTYSFVYNNVFQKSPHSILCTYAGASYNRLNTSETRFLQ